MTRPEVQVSADSRNPFGIMDVPDPDDREVTDFATATSLDGGADDANAAPWSVAADADAIDGVWSSRWNGGADPTIFGDAPDRWKQGVAEIKTARERVYLRFDWDGGRRRGLIDARREGDRRLVGKYINLTDPRIVRPWVGRIVDSTRIDGRWTGGRLDFRR
jgi:hypothetical protein